MADLIYPQTLASLSSCCRVWPPRLPVPAHGNERTRPGVHHAVWHQRGRSRGLRPQRAHLTPGLPPPPSQAPQRPGVTQRHRRPVHRRPWPRPWRHPAPQPPGLRSLAPPPPPQRESEFTAREDKREVTPCGILHPRVGSFQFADVCVCAPLSGRRHVHGAPPDRVVRLYELSEPLQQ